MLKLMATSLLTLVLTVALHAQQPGGEDLKQQQAELQREIDELKTTFKRLNGDTKVGVPRVGAGKTKIAITREGHHQY